MPHHHRFTYIRRTKAFREALDAAPPQVVDAVADVVTRLRDGTAKDLTVLRYWGDPQLGLAWTMALPSCNAFILYREWVDQALLQLVQLVCLDD